MARAQNERYISELERSKQKLQEQISTIAKRQMAIHELPSPIAEVWEDILLLPVIGSLDSQRAFEMTEKLLDRIKQTRSACVIIDITGVGSSIPRRRGAMLKMTRAATGWEQCVLTHWRAARDRAHHGAAQHRSRRCAHDAHAQDGLRACFDLLRRRRDQRRRHAENGDGLVFGQKAKGTTSAAQGKLPATHPRNRAAAPWRRHQRPLRPTNLLQVPVQPTCWGRGLAARGNHESQARLERRYGMCCG